ncbi:asparaginase [Microbacteriaceae bacterium VKM Ac-2854]|nr:asparaginase [Microbacteriaceae bacterium VKM Ac-2854]
MPIPRSRRLTGGVLSAAMAVGIAVAALPAVAPAASAYDLPDFPLTAIGPERDPAKPDIVVIDAGGTLASTAQDRISYLHYGSAVPGGVQQILEDMYPELAAVANLSVAKSPGSLGSSSRVTSQTLYEISRETDALLADPEIDGVVVTAGTSVMEEDAYFLDLTVQSPKPVVVTGSMHQYGTFTYDAYTNLFSSIRLAASQKTNCYGTVVLMNDQFFAARDVTKTDGYRMDTFESALYGPLGVVNEDNIRPMRAPARVMACGTDAWHTPFDLSTVSPEQFPQVDVVGAYVEASAATISGPVDAGAKGIVTAGEGPGGLSSTQSAARTDAIAKGVLFVAATRTGGEGEYDAGTAGVIGAADLRPIKARLLLQMGLTFSSDQEQIRSWFGTIGAAEFDLSGATAVTPEPTTEPTAEPTAEPTNEPSAEPSATPAPTDAASAEPTPSASSAALPISNDDDGPGGLAYTGLAVGGLVALAALLLAVGALTIWRERIMRWREERRLVGEHS